MKTRSPWKNRTIAAACGVLAGTALLAVAPSATAGSTGALQTYLVVYKTGSSTAGAASSIASAGGTLVASYPQIGVVVARSTNTAFGTTMGMVKGVDGAAATTRLGTRLDGSVADTADTETAPVAPGTADSLAGLQWDMDQINAPAAHAINTGAGVVVGDIDTGLDYTHPDLAANVDFSRSVSCVGGVPNTSPAAWMDDNGHGTHTAGTIGAAANGIGIVGVAPDVKIAGIKAGNAAGFFYPEAVVCSFVWAAEHGIAVTNNSYFADPWLFNCKNDPTQRAIWTAERRAIKYAQSKGSLVVAAAGNQSDDLSHPTADATSPDDTNPVLRDVSNACAVVPVEVPGVVGVSATGNLGLKSFYSSYGISAIDVAAPGGDSILQRTAAAPNGRVLSTWPASLMAGCLRKVTDPSGATYCYAQGTSMASPHVAGVAALLASASGKTGGALSAALQNAVNPIACPADVSPWAPFPAIDNGAPQTCEGTLTQNSWYGAGQVDAAKAVQ